MAKRKIMMDHKMNLYMKYRLKTCYLERIIRTNTNLTLSRQEFLVVITSSPIDIPYTMTPSGTNIHKTKISVKLNILIQY